MNFGKEEANLIFEDRNRGRGSPESMEESDDDDCQQELEERLYSQVYHNDPVINTTSSEEKDFPALSITSQAVNAGTSKSQLGFASSGVNEPIATVGRLQLQPGCAQSQFNHPNRQKASRYYDENKDISNPDPIFVTPKTPGQKQNATHTKGAFMSRLIARSVKEVSYTPNSKSQSSVTARADKLPSGRGAPLVSTCIVDKSDKINSVKCQGQLCSDYAEKEQSEALLCKESSSCQSKNEETPRKANKRNEECIKQVSPASSGETKQQSFEAKVSKVLSSMLDDESRSSLDEDLSPSMCRNQNANDVTSDTCWSVGMSWADMSSKFSFEVDAIDEESVSSLQPEDPVPGGSRTNTQNPLSRLDGGEEEDSREEESKYNMQLNSSKRKSVNKQKDISESDSESEVGSVVEVAPPVKPTPPLVDISDGEYVPVNKSEKNRNVTRRNCNEDICVIESSSDDDIVILNESSKSNTMTVPRGQPKRQSSEMENFSPGETHRKRASHSRDKNYADVFTGEQRLLNQGRAFLSTSMSVNCSQIEADRLQQWLYDPITAFKSYDHKKLLRKMSDDPKLWEINYDDKIQCRVSPEGPKCLNCNQFGHRKRACTAPWKAVVCRMCGAPGHSEPRCPLKMCLRCGRKGNIYTDRCKFCVTNTAPCKICESRTHSWKRCPDMWRRYHLTISPGEINKPSKEDFRPPSEQWCSNCARNGHLSHECQQSFWKCESICPYIKSYASVAMEEEKLEGSGEAIMIMTNEDSKTLSSKEGSELLFNLSKEFNVSIHASLDTTVASPPKLTLEGTSQNQHLVQVAIKDWVNDFQRELCTLNKKIQSSKCQEWILPPSRALKKYRLKQLLREELKMIERPIQCDLTIRELYNFICENKKSPRSSNQTLMKHYYRFLNIILIGKCGFEDGKKHIQALKEFVKRLTKVKTLQNETYKVLCKHYDPIFSCTPRHNYQELVARFYENVRKFGTFETIREGDTEAAEESDKRATAVDDHIVEFSPPSSSECLNMRLLEKKKETVKTDDAVESRTSLSSEDQSENETGGSKEPIKICLEDKPKPIKKKINPVKRSKSVDVLRNEVTKRAERVQKIVPVMIKNLSSRFIFCKDQEDLVDLYKKFNNSRKANPTNRLHLLSRMLALTEKLGKSYKVKLVP